MIVGNEKTLQEGQAIRYAGRQPIRILSFSDACSTIYLPGIIYSGADVAAETGIR